MLRIGYSAAKVSSGPVGPAKRQNARSASPTCRRIPRRAAGAEVPINDQAGAEPVDQERTRLIARQDALDLFLLSIGW